MIEPPLRVMGIARRRGDDSESSEPCAEKRLWIIEEHIFQFVVIAALELEQSRTDFFFIRINRRRRRLADFEAEKLRIHLFVAFSAKAKVAAKEGIPAIFVYLLKANAAKSGLTA